MQNSVLLAIVTGLACLSMLANPDSERSYAEPEATIPAGVVPRAHLPVVLAQPTATSTPQPTPTWTPIPTPEPTIAPPHPLNTLPGSVGLTGSIRGDYQTGPGGQYDCLGFFIRGTVYNASDRPIQLWYFHHRVRSAWDGPVLWERLVPLYTRPDALLAPGDTAYMPGIVAPCEESMSWPWYDTIVYWYYADRGPLNLDLVYWPPKTSFLRPCGPEDPPYCRQWLNVVVEYHNPWPVTAKCWGAFSVCADSWIEGPYPLASGENGVVVLEECMDYPHWETCLTDYHEGRKCRFRGIALDAE
jgi:hypothetical protein